MILISQEFHVYYETQNILTLGKKGRKGHVCRCLHLHNYTTLQKYEITIKVDFSLENTAFWSQILSNTIMKQNEACITTKAAFHLISFSLFFKVITLA